MTVEAFLERKSRRSDATKLTYSKAELAFAKCFGVESVDMVVSRIKARKLDAYEALDKFVGYLLVNGSAPKTVLTYTSAIKDIAVDAQKLRDKVELPPKVKLTIPTREEMRSIILNSDRRTRKYG